MKSQPHGQSPYRLPGSTPGEDMYAMFRTSYLECCACVLKFVTSVWRSYIKVGCKEAPALQDIQETKTPENVREDDGSARPFAPPDAPENDTQGDHARKMLEAFEQRKPANTPVMKKAWVCKAAAKAKG